MKCTLCNQELTINEQGTYDTNICYSCFVKEFNELSDEEVDDILDELGFGNTDSSKDYLD